MKIELRLDAKQLKKVVQEVLAELELQAKVERPFVPEMDVVVGRVYQDEWGDEFLVTEVRSVFEDVRGKYTKVRSNNDPGLVGSSGLWDFNWIKKEIKQ